MFKVAGRTTSNFKNIAQIITKNTLADQIAAVPLTCSSGLKGGPNDGEQIRQYSCFLFQW